MELTEVQMTLLKGLQFLHLEEDNIKMVMLMLKSEEQQMGMLLWLADNIKKGISQEKVMDNAQEIMISLEKQ
jgi:hypothetical protein